MCRNVAVTLAGLLQCKQSVRASRGYHSGVCEDFPGMSSVVPLDPWKWKHYFPSKRRAPSSQRQAAVPEPVRHGNGPVLNLSLFSPLPANGQLPVQRAVGADWQQLTGCGSELNTTNLPAYPSPFLLCSQHWPRSRQTEGDIATRGPQNTLNLCPPPPPPPPS